MVQKYHERDLYRTVGLSKNKISFKDLTPQQNLNYVKFNLKNSIEAFQYFEIIKEKFGLESPDIPAALVQKIASRTKDFNLRPVRDKIVPRVQYKQMLKLIKKNITKLENRHFVDTVFSIGKIHKLTESEEMA